MDASPPVAPPVVWRLLDGRPGHENQTAGLLEALAERVPIERYDVRVERGWRNLVGWLRGRCPYGAGVPRPSILVGAGHATHLPLLACARAWRAHSVVLMRPSLPLRWFDLCILPSHDGVPPGDQVLVTRGALNAVRPALTKRADHGVILVGGPSRHHGWSSVTLVSQVKTILERDTRAWTIATSRRTPPETGLALKSLGTDRLRVVEPSEVAQGWLAEQLGHAPVAWITEDSVSMIYEALTAGAACGLLAVPRKGAGRVKQGVDGLVSEGLLVRFEAWRSGAKLAPPAQPFDEADRCARWIVDTWLDD